MFALEFRGEVNREETSHGASRWWKLHDPDFNRFWLIHPCDGQTDGRAIAYRAIAYMLSRAKQQICRCNSSITYLFTV